MLRGFVVMCVKYKRAWGGFGEERKGAGGVHSYRRRSSLQKLKAHTQEKIKTQHVRECRSYHRVQPLKITCTFGAERGVEVEIETEN
jgi:hypothetical protein